MDAKELESLSMLSRGFTELKQANPELAYNLVLDILSGINEYVFTMFVRYLLDVTLVQQSSRPATHLHNTRIIPPSTHPAQHTYDAQRSCRCRARRS
jgi:hypothetical protein